jgi:hypothetical protein
MSETDIVRIGAHSSFSLSSRIVAVLVENEMGDMPVGACEEFELSVRNFHKELAWRLRKEGEFALIGGLLHQLSVF